MKLNFEHLLGRQYVPGKDHCYKLVQDFYRDNFGIVMGNYALPVDWNSDELNLIELVWEQEGFTKVEGWTIRNLQPGDLLCMAVRTANPNHFGIYVGDNTLLHHPLMQLSRTEVLRDFWRMSTCFVLRHPDVPDLTPTLAATTIKELADARYSPQAQT